MSYLQPRKRYRRATWHQFRPLLPRLDTRRVPGWHQPAPPAKRLSLLARVRAWLSTPRELLP